MAERIVQEESLLTVADAIREKTGGTERLAFPEGFVEAISGISGGSVLDALIERSITEISSNAKKIGDNAFYGYSNLTTVNIPSATQIRGSAFYNCTSLHTANFPLVITIMGNAFYGCTALTEANFPSLTKENGSYDFYNCKALTTINFPLLTRVENSTFQSCEKLTNINFPKVTYVNTSAFENCYTLKTADFPSLTGFGNRVFYNCRSLIAVILRSKIMATVYNIDSFTNCYHFSGRVDATYNPDGLKDGYIYVPSALVDTYKADSKWSTYATQFRALEDYTVDGTITGALDETKI